MCVLVVICQSGKLRWGLIGGGTGISPMLQIIDEVIFWGRTDIEVNSPHTTRLSPCPAASLSVSVSLLVCVRVVRSG